MLDNRTGEWFYWTTPIKIDYMLEDTFKADNVDEQLTYVYSGNKKYSFTTTTYYLKNQDDRNQAEDIETYQDYLGNGEFFRIHWLWRSTALTLNIINYIKKLVSVSVLFADRSRELEYDVLNDKYTITTPGDPDNLQLFYTFKAYRKKSKFLDSNFSGQIDYVKNLKIKPRLQKFDFLELTFTNKKEDDHGNVKWTYQEYMPDPDNDTIPNKGLRILDKFNLIGLTFRMTASEGA